MGKKTRVILTSDSCLARIFSDALLWFDSLTLPHSSPLSCFGILWHFPFFQLTAYVFAARKTKKILSIFLGRPPTVWFMLSFQPSFTFFFLFTTSRSPFIISFTRPPQTSFPSISHHTSSLLASAKYFCQKIAKYICPNWKVYLNTAATAPHFPAFLITPAAFWPVPNIFV